MALAAVTLDAAGTLFEVAEPVGETYARAAARHGIALAPSETEQRFRDALRDAPPLAFSGSEIQARVARERAWWKSVVRRAFGPESAAAGFDACFAELFAYYARAEAWRVFPEVTDTLVRLRAAGHRVAVVSNFDERLIDLLSALGLAPLLDLVMPSVRAGAAKPDPAIFQAALEALGVRPDDALHAGDGLVDVEGARAAGLRAVLVDRRGVRPSLPDDVRRIASLAELPALTAV